MSDALTFSCPHCQYLHTDELEVLDADQIHTFSCENCHKEFQLLIKDCHFCHAESTFTTNSIGAETALIGQVCNSCGRNHKSDEDEDHDL